MWYHVEILLPDGQNWRTLCRCESVEKLTAVLTGLLSNSEFMDRYIRIQLVPSEV